MQHHIYKFVLALCVMLAMTAAPLVSQTPNQAYPQQDAIQEQREHQKQQRQQQRMRGSQTAITGTVLTKSSNEALAGVNVIIAGTELGTASDADGEFKINKIPAGQYIVRAQMMGYANAEQEVTLEENETVNLTFQLESTVLNGETVVVTGTRSPRYLKDTPVKTQVVTSAEIRNRNPANILEAAGAAAVGIDASMECSICNVASISLQGMPGRYTQVLVDGIPQYSSLGQMYTYMQLPTNFIDQVEIVKGANSALYGTDAISGIVNLQTKNPGNHPEMNLDTQMGQHGERRLSGTASFREDRLGILVTGEYYTINATDRDGDGISEFLGNRQGYLNGKVKYDFSDNTNLQVRLSGINDSRQGGMISSNNSYIEVISEEEARAFSETIFTNRIEGSAILEHNLNNQSSLTFKTNAAHHYQDSDYEGFVYVADQYMTYNEIQYSHRLKAGHAFAGGLSYRTELLDENAAISEYDYRIGSAFGQFNWKPSTKFEAVAGLRWDHHNVFGDIVTPSTSVRAWLNNQWVARLSYGEGFRAPTTFYELDHGTGAKYKYNIQYLAKKAERSRSLAFSLDYANFRHSLSISPFHHWINNYITAFNDAENERFVVQNVDKLSRFYGIEAEYDFVLSEKVSVMAGHIFQRIAIDSGVLGFARPENRFKWGLDYNHRKLGMALNLNGSVTGPMELSSVYGESLNQNGTTKLDRSPAFALVNAELGKTLGSSGVQISIGAKNLFDFNQADLEGPLVFDAEGNLEDVGYIWGPLRGRIIYARMTLNIE